MIEIRKSMLTMGSIICLFVLISISYQPIIAEESIEQISKINEYKLSVNKISRLNNLFIRAVKLTSKYNSDNDCDCEKNGDLKDKICDLLYDLLNTLSSIRAFIFYNELKILYIIGYLSEMLIFPLMFITLLMCGYPDLI